MYLDPNLAGVTRIVRWTTKRKWSLLAGDDIKLKFQPKVLTVLTKTTSTCALHLDFEFLPTQPRL